MPTVIVIAALAFSGALVTVIPAGEVLQKVAIAVVALLAIGMHLHRPVPRRAIGLIWPFVAYLVIATLSAFGHSSSMGYTLAAIQPLLLGLILYLWAIGLRLQTDDLVKLRTFVYAIVLIQLVFVLIKLGVHGVDEKVFIGTMSNAAGQLGFLFPAIVVPILVFMMDKKNSLTSYVLIAAMFLFGIINEKRAVVFLLPLILLVSIAANHAGFGARVRGLSTRMVAGVLIAVAGVALGISAIPSLNAEEAYGGSISIRHALDYGITYLTMNFGGPLQGTYVEAVSDTGVQVGRTTLWISIFDWLMSGDTWTLLFGSGFGTATSSIWLREGGDNLFSVIGTRGAISGAGLAAVETGLVGLLTMGWLFVSVTYGLVAVHRKVHSSTAKRWLRTLMIIHLVFCFDFFFYSIVLFRTMPMPFVFFVLLASISLVSRWDDTFRSGQVGLVHTRKA